MSQIQLIQLSHHILWSWVSLIHQLHSNITHTDWHPHCNITLRFSSCYSSVQTIPAQNRKTRQKPTNWVVRRWFERIDQGLIKYSPEATHKGRHSETVLLPHSARDPSSIPASGHCFWSLLILSVSAWVSSGYSSVLPQSKDVRVRLIDHAKLTLVSGA